MEVDGRKVGGTNFAMIAGPCTVESREQLLSTAEAVKEHLAHHPVVHFACHGVLDLENPGESELLLPAGPGGGLTVRDLTALRLPRSTMRAKSAISSSRPVMDIVLFYATVMFRNPIL